jgi:uncharacterized protein YceH (UPF0502 family)
VTLALDPTERRIVGTLVEKELSVPESYPLTVNALVLGCNQKSNRDPESAYPEHEVEGAVAALMHRGWVLEHEKAGGRARRYAHRAREQLSVDDADLALLAELLLRGPQSPQELERRAARLRPVGDASEVERRLEALAARPVPYVRRLARRPGERTPRWEHLLGGAQEAAPAASAGHAVPARPTPPPVAGPVASSGRPAVPAGPADLPALAARIARLERDVASLRAQVARLAPPPSEEEELETT